MGRPQEARLDTLAGVVRNAAPGAQQDAPRELLGFDLDRAGGYVALWKRADSALLTLPSGIIHHDELGNALLAGRRVHLNGAHYGPVSELQGQQLAFVPSVGVVGTAEPQPEDRYLLGALVHDVFGDTSVGTRLSSINVSSSGSGTEVAAGSYRFMVLLQAPTSAGFVTYQVLTRDYNNGSSASALVATLSGPLPVGYAARAFWWNTASAEPSFEELGARQISDGSNMRFRLTSSEILDPTSVALVRFQGLAEVHRNRVWGQASEQAFSGPYVAGFEATQHFEATLAPSDDSSFTLLESQNDEIDAHFEADRTWRVTTEWNRGVTVALTSASFTPRTSTLTTTGSVSYRAMGSDNQGHVYALEGTDSGSGTLRVRNADGHHVRSHTANMDGPTSLSVREGRAVVAGNFYVSAWSVEDGSAWHHTKVFSAGEGWRSVLSFAKAGAPFYAAGSSDTTIDILRANGTLRHRIETPDLPPGVSVDFLAYLENRGYLMAVSHNPTGNNIKFNAWYLGSTGAPSSINPEYSSEELGTAVGVAASRVSDFVYYAREDRLGRINVWEQARTSNWRAGAYQGVWTDRRGFVYAYRHEDGSDEHILECLTEDNELVWSVDLGERLYSLAEFAPQHGTSEPYGSSGELMLGMWGEVWRLDPVAMEVQVARRFDHQFQVGVAIEKASPTTARAVPYVRLGERRRVLLRSDNEDARIRDALGRDEWGLSESVTLLAGTRARWQMYRQDSALDNPAYMWFEAERADGTLAVARDTKYSPYMLMSDGSGSVRVASLPFDSDESESATLSAFEVQFASSSSMNASGVTTRARLKADAYSGSGSTLPDDVEGTWSFNTALVSITGGHAVFGSSLDPDTTLVYSDVGTANEGSELNYVRLNFATSTHVTGLRSTPAGLLAFGENEAFLLRSDPSLSDFQVQRVSGTLGCDRTANTTRLGGIVFTIWRGRIYSVALGMGDVDFGSGINEISQHVYRPDDPFVEVAGEARSRELVARTQEGRVYRYLPDRQAWITDVYDAVEGLTGLLPHEDAQGVRYVLNGRELRTAEEGADDPTVLWEHVDFGDPDRVKMLRRIRFHTSSDYQGFPTVAYGTEFESGEVFARDVGNKAFVATLPAGVLGRTVTWRITLNDASTHAVLRPPVIVEYVPRYRER